MGNLIDLDKTRKHLALALEVVHHDRWVFGSLAFVDGRCIGEYQHVEFTKRIR